MGAGAGVVSDPDAEVLDLQGALLVDLGLSSAPCRSQPNQSTYHVQADDFTVRLLDLSELHQEVPETRLRNHGVWRKDPHSVQLGRWVCLGGQMAANDLVFCETTCTQKVSFIFQIVPDFVSVDRVGRGDAAVT